MPGLETHGSQSELYPLSEPTRERAASNWPYRGGRFDWGKRLEQEAQLLFEQKGSTIEEISDALNVQRRTVRRKLALTKRDARIHDAVVLYDRGLRLDVIAGQMGYSAETVRQYLREARG